MLPVLSPRVCCILCYESCNYSAPVVFYFRLPLFMKQFPTFLWCFKWNFGLIFVLVISFKIREVMAAGQKATSSSVGFDFEIGGKDGFSRYFLEARQFNYSDHEPVDLAWVDLRYSPHLTEAKLIITLHGDCRMSTDHYSDNFINDQSLNYESIVALPLFYWLNW